MRENESNDHTAKGGKKPYVLYTTMYSNLYLLLWKVLRNFILINDLSTFQFLLFNPLDTLTLDISSTDQHTLEGSQAEIIVTLR